MANLRQMLANSAAPADPRYSANRDMSFAPQQLVTHSQPTGYVGNDGLVLNAEERAALASLSPEKLRELINLMPPSFGRRLAEMVTNLDEAWEGQEDKLETSLHMDWAAINRQQRPNYYKNRPKAPTNNDGCTCGANRPQQGSEEVIANSDLGLDDDDILLPQEMKW